MHNKNNIGYIQDQANMRLKNHIMIGLSIPIGYFLNPIENYYEPIKNFNILGQNANICTGVVCTYFEV